jgi:hypothetical protein
MASEARKPTYGLTRGQIYDLYTEELKKAPDGRPEAKKVYEALCALNPEISSRKTEIIFYYARSVYMIMDLLKKKGKEEEFRRECETPAAFPAVKTNAPAVARGGGATGRGGVRQAQPTNVRTSQGAHVTVTQHVSPTQQASAQVPSLSPLASRFASSALSISRVSRTNATSQNVARRKISMRPRQPNPSGKSTRMPTIGSVTVRGRPPGSTIQNTRGSSTSATRGGRVPAIQRQKAGKKLKSTTPKPCQHDERGILVSLGIDLCDCLDAECEGCFLECYKCGGNKCGYQCRSKRGWNHSVRVDEHFLRSDNVLIASHREFFFDVATGETSESFNKTNTFVRDVAPPDVE